MALLKGFTIDKNGNSNRQGGRGNEPGGGTNYKITAMRGRKKKTL